MVLQRGNVDTNPGPVPQPWLTLKDFRSAFTEELRTELAKAVEAYYRSLRRPDVPEGQVCPDAHREVLPARTALQLIAGLHPPPYEW